MWRRSWSWKYTVESTKRISVKSLKTWWALKDSLYIWWKMSWTCRGEESWNIRYYVNTLDENEMYLNPVFIQTDKETGEKKDFNYKVKLVKTSCNYGGFRYWFVCPNCKKRYWVLSIHRDWYFYCRKCLKLCYSKQLESKRYRLWSKILSSRDEEDEAYKIYCSMKYKHRNWKPTRKYKRYLKLTRAHIPLETVRSFENSIYRQL